MRFYLGTHKPAWLGRFAVPLFVSRRRLAEVRRPPQALAQWALDSGGFTELSMFGTWRTSASQYAREAERWHSQIGRMEWAAVQDWMCEPHILAKTGKTVQEHQERTLQSYLDLLSLAPLTPWAPVLQGWHHDDYLAHVGLYSSAGIDLRTLPIVGIGSVCRRQATALAEEVIRDLAALGIRLHGFGLKTLALPRLARSLASSDSMAWSFAARMEPVYPGCTHKTCANCPLFAMRWRRRVLDAIDSAQPVQPGLFDGIM